MKNMKLKDVPAVKDAIELLESLGILHTLTEEETDGEKIGDYYGVRFVKEYKLEENI